MSSSRKRSAEELDGDGLPVHEAAGRLFDNVGQVGGSRKKLASSARTGQACDRCKVRKIRCDARPGGCSPCLQNNSECKTTDRITGRATSRGHTEQIENENTALRMYMLELQQQLRESGVEPKAPPNMSQTFAAFQPYWDGNGQQGSWGDLHSASVVPTSSKNERHNSVNSNLQDFRPGCVGDNYVGVSSSDPRLSPIEGMQLSLFGMKLDLAEFLPSEGEDPLSDPLSYQSFLAFAFNINGANQVSKPALPNYHECTSMADWFFKAVQVFIPILHKPHFMKLLSRVHYAHQDLNSAETVMVHMVITIMTFQGALRNSDEQRRHDALDRFHYCLSFIPQLISGHQLQDIQALALICSFLRSQPRIGAAYIFTNGILGLAIESGLHRSASAWYGDAAETDPHTIEMRKRVFWSLVVIHVNISGKLGRPMPLRMEDFDIEIPEQIADNLPGETNLSKWEKCSFRAAIPGIKLLKVLMRVYSTMYAVRRGNEPYEVTMRNLEQELKKWRSELPPEFDENQIAGGDRMPAYYLYHAEQAMRLLIHHPSLSRNMSPQVTSSNMDECLDASAKMLEITEKAKAINSLDTTWYTAVDYLAAIFTTLFACSQRQAQMTTQDLLHLKHDMQRWLDIMGDVGKLLGSGPRLRHTLQSTYIAPCLQNISQSLAAKTASAGLASVDQSSASPVEAPTQSHMYHNANGFADSFSSNPGSNGGANSDQQSYAINGRTATHAQDQQHYQSGHYYTDAQHPSMQPYMGNFDASYANEDVKPNINTDMSAHVMQPPQDHHQTPVQQHQMAAQQAPAGFIAAFQPGALPQNSFHPQNPNMPMQHSWRHFADVTIPNMNNQDYVDSSHMNSAGTLPHGGMDMSAAASVASMGGMQMVSDAQQPWPMIYNDPVNQQ